LQESRGAPQGSRIFEVFAAESLAQNLPGLVDLAIAGESLSESRQNERIGNALGAQFLFDFKRSVTPAMGARARPIPGEALVAGIACCAELCQSMARQRGRITPVS
jgi:hypothetical protein